MRALNNWKKLAGLPAVPLRGRRLQCSDSPFLGSYGVPRSTCRRAVVLSAACLCVLALGGKAAASPVTTISWAVTGGYLFKNGALGTTAEITGGSAVWTPGSTVFTPTVMPSQVSGSLLITLQAAGTSIVFTFQRLIGTLTPLYAVLGGPFPIPEPGTFGSINYSASLQSVYVFFLNGTSTVDYHSATLGQEVRTATAVPEPSSAALVGLGLVVLAGTARAGARVLRRRTHAVPRS